MPQTATVDNRRNDDAPVQFMSLSLGPINILANRNDILSIESLDDIERTEPLNKSIGWIHVEDKAVPVYSFNDKLEIEQSIHTNKSVCVVLKCNDIIISLMCQEASPFKRHIIKIQNLPECMQATQCPFDSLCLYTNEDKSDIYFISSVKSLLEYINKHST